MSFLDKLFRMFGSNNSGFSGLKNKKILVVDDGEVERKFFVTVLKKRGCTVSSAENGKAALEKIKLDKPDLILLDFVMPEMNGKEFCKVVKNDESLKNIPVIFLTGSTTPGDVVDCYDVGAEYFLTKPISAKMLNKQVEAAFEDVKAGY